MKDTKHMREIWRYSWQDGDSVYAEFDTIKECGVFEAWTAVSMTELRRERAMVGLDHKNALPAGYPAATVHNFTKPFDPDSPSTDWTAREALLHALNKLNEVPYFTKVVIT